MPLAHYDILLVERAIDDLKRGVPVVLENKERAVLALPVEYLDQASLDLLAELSSEHQAQVLLTATRAHVLTPSIEFDSPIKTPFTTIDDTRALSGLIESIKLPHGSISSADALERAVLKLIKIGEFLPSAIICEINRPIPDGLLTLTAEHIERYQHKTVTTLDKISSAELPLQGAEISRIVAFGSP